MISTGQTYENSMSILVDNEPNLAIPCLPMKTKRSKPKKEQLNFRPKPQDKAILEAGQRKHGVDQAQIIRMALRRFAEAEGIPVAS